MNTSIFIFSLIALQAVCWWAGKRTAKGVKTQNDYFLGGRSVAFLPLMATFLATQVGGGIVLGSAQEAQTVGWWVVFYPLGQVLGLILLGCGIGKRLSCFKVSTVAQIFEVAYRSPFLKRTASLLSIISLFMILIGQVIASKKFLLALGVDEPWLFVLFWGVLIAYTSIGGMKAVIATDLIQAFFLIAIFLFAFGVAYFSGAAPSVFDASTFETPVEKFSGWLLLPFLFTFIEQDMGQRCFAASTPSVLAKASIGAGLAAFSICLIPIYFGILGQQYGIQGEGSILMGAVSIATNPAVAALVGCAVIAAILSTANSLINAIGSNLSEDFLVNRRSMTLTKGLSALIGIGAIFASFAFSSIVDVLMLSYELSISCLFVPLMAALFGKKKRFSWEAGCAIACGAFGFFFLRFVSIPFPKEMAALLLSLFGFFAGAWIARARESLLLKRGLR